MLLHKEKKIYRVLEGTVFILLSAFCPQSSSLFNGLLAPSCLLIGRISYRNGTGIESKPEGSADRQPTQAICLHATTVPQKKKLQVLQFCLSLAVPSPQKVKSQVSAKG